MQQSPESLFPSREERSAVSACRLTAEGAVSVADCAPLSVEFPSPIVFAVHDAKSEVAPSVRTAAIVIIVFFILILILPFLAA